MFQYFLDNGSVPDDWRTANIVPLHKKGSRSDPLNYRPISLTCITSKIFEHIISHDIHGYLESHNLLANCQHGFRRLHGCDTQLMTTITDFIDAYDQDVSLDTAVLDFSMLFRIPN